MNFCEFCCCLWCGYIEAVFLAELCGADTKYAVTAPLEGD